MAEPSSVRCPRFLAEWYRADVTGAAVDDVIDKLARGAAEARDDGARVELLVALLVPTDEVFYGLYSAQSADDVLAACTRAGIPAERLSANVDARLHSPL